MRLRSWKSVDFLITLTCVGSYSNGSSSKIELRCAHGRLQTYGT
jgi:hypothetical protein